MSKSPKNNLEKLNFETAMAKLEEVVEKLNNGKIELEEMVNLYEQAVELREFCNNKLNEAKMKVEVLMKSN